MWDCQKGIFYGHMTLPQARGEAHTLQVREPDARQASKVATFLGNWLEGNVPTTVTLPSGEKIPREVEVLTPKKQVNAVKLECVPVTPPSPHPTVNPRDTSSAWSCSAQQAGRHR